MISAKLETNQETNFSNFENQSFKKGIFESQFFSQCELSKEIFDIPLLMILIVSLIDLETSIRRTQVELKIAKLTYSNF